MRGISDTNFLRTRAQMNVSINFKTRSPFFHAKIVKTPSVNVPYNKNKNCFIIAVIYGGYRDVDVAMSWLSPVRYGP
jgi:hypothetical protein